MDPADYVYANVMVPNWKLLELFMELNFISHLASRSSQQNTHSYTLTEEHKSGTKD